MSSNAKIISIKARISAIQAEVSTLRENLAKLQSEHDKLALAVDVWENFDDPRAEIKRAFVEIQKIHESRSNYVSQARDTNRARIINILSAEPMTRGQIVDKLQKAGPVNSQSIASLLSRLVSEGIAAKRGSGRYVKCEIVSVTSAENPKN